jgi:4-hydroxy-tetrahydrodipicolinate synthase
MGEDQKNYDDAMACRETWLDMLPMFHFTYSAINPVPLKSLMAALGLPAGDLRRPLTALEGDALQKGLDLVRELGIADKYGFTLRGPRAAAE